MGVGSNSVCDVIWDVSFFIRCFGKIFFPQFLINDSYDLRTSRFWCRYPFVDSENSKLFRKIREESFSIPRTTTTLAKNLITLVLQKEPKKRPTCAEILRHPWFLKHSSSNNNIVILLPLYTGGVRIHVCFYEFGKMKNFLTEF